MKIIRNLTAILCCIYCSVCMGGNVESTGNDSQTILEIINRVNTYWQTNNSAQVRSFWDNAAYHTGNMEVYKLLKDRKFLQYSIDWAKHNEWKGAKSDKKEEWRYDYGETDEFVLFGDYQICFQTYCDLYNLEPADYKIARAKEVMEYQMSTDKNDYWWWADGLYMVMPVMTKLYNITGNSLYLDKLYEYLSYADGIMYDAEAGLYYRDARYVYPAHKTDKGRKDFWARGDGWVFAGLAKVLQDLPANEKHRAHYTERFKTMAQAIAASQQAEGYWTRSMLDPEQAPGYETSGTAFFTYGLLWGMNNGLLDKEHYEPVVAKAWQYLTTVALQKDGKVGYVQPIGDRAIPGQVIDANSTANFGVGAYLLAACEMYRFVNANDADVNLAAGWDGNGATGAGSKPTDFGWACSVFTDDGWGEANGSGVRYVDNQSYLPGGRLMFVRWDGVGGSNAGSVYSYPVMLEAYTPYAFSLQYTRHSNQIKDFVIGINSKADNTGVSLVSGAFAPETQSFKTAAFKFVSQAAGTYYITVGSSASGMLGAITDLQVKACDSALESSESSIELNYFGDEKTITVFPNGTSNAIHLTAFEGIKLSPSVLPAYGGDVVVSSDNFKSVAGNIQVRQGSETLQIAVKTDFPEDFMPTQALDTLTTNGAWCWFADPRAVYHKGTKEQTYFSWITTEGDIVVASYNHQTKEYHQHTIWKKYQEDDHANPSLLIRDDGRIIIFMAAHFGAKISRFISTNPEDITSWGEKYDFAQTVTYPYPFKMGETIYVFYRGGSSWHPHLAVSTDNGETFAEPNLFITGGGQRPYTRYCQGPDGSIHVAVTTGHPRNEANNKIHYCRFKDNAFYKADGTKIRDYVVNGTATPIEITELETVYDANTGKGWIWDITLEPETGYPVMVYASFPTDLDHRYHYARWNGTSWFSKQITEAGRWFPQTPEGAGEPEPNYSGGIIMDYDDPSTVYLSKQVKGVFEIFKYTTPDKGETWNVKAMTWNTPTGLINARPIVPRHHKEGFFDVIWMRGTYVYYADQKYSTALVFPSALAASELSGMELNRATLDLIQDETAQLTLNFFPTFAAKEEISWTSSDERVVTVANGKVTALSEGVAVITATSRNGISATCEVTVKKVTLMKNAFFDFGTTDSPVAEGAVRITESSLLGNGSYGWLTPVISRSRTTGNAELQDFNMASSPSVFKVYVEDGEYEITVKQGDYDFGHDQMSLAVNGKSMLSGITNAKGAIIANTFKTTTDTKTLEFQFADNGGSDANWVVNSVSIKQISSSHIPDNTIDFNDPDTQITVQDLSGRTLFQEKLGYRSFSVVMSEHYLMIGTYLVTLSLKGRKETTKYISMK